VDVDVASDEDEERCIGDDGFIAPKHCAGENADAAPSSNSSEVVRLANSENILIAVQVILLFFSASLQTNNNRSDTIRKIDW